MTQIVKDLVTWLKQWFYTESEVDTLLGGKVSVAQGNDNATKNVVTDSGGNIAFEAKPTIPQASSTTPSADVSGGAVGSGTTWAKADHQHPLSSAYATSGHTHGNLQNNGAVGTSNNASKNVVTDSNGKITTEAKYSHPSSHASSMITEASALGNIGTSANASQHDVNDAINTVLGSLSAIDVIKVVDTKPTASADTMNKLYIVSENSKVNVYYTKRSGSAGSYTYAWQKMDTDILDELSISWSDVTNKPTNLLISTIDLIDAGETNEGCIIFNTL